MARGAAKRECTNHRVSDRQVDSKRVSIPCLVDTYKVSVPSPKGSHLVNVPVQVTTV